MLESDSNLVEAEAGERCVGFSSAFTHDKIGELFMVICAVRFDKNDFREIEHEKKY